MVSVHRVAPVGTASAGWFPVSSGRLAFGRAIHLAASLIALALAAAGVPLNSPTITIAACAAMLLFGLPHGAFDLALIKRAHVNQRLPAVVALYLFCAFAMYGLWQTAPVMALLAFFVLSIIHFAEDWTSRMPPLLAHGAATAVLSAPALLHQETITGLFALLVGDTASQLFGAIATLIAPVSLATAGVATLVLWIDGHRGHAMATAMALCTMMLLPPLIGFALFFCLMHSPTQFAAAQHLLVWNRVRQWAPVVAPLTCAALGIAVVVFDGFATFTLTNAMVATAFTTLSILTLPHLAVPLIMDRIARATA